MVSGSKFTMAEKNAEDFVSLLKQLSGILGGSADLESLCISSAINPWAKYKPLRSSTLVNLSVAERHEKHYGLSQNPNTYYVEYERVGSGDRKRLRDFDGYNHLAVPPIAVTTKFNNTVSFSGGPTGLTFSPDDLVVDSAEIKLNEIGVYETYGKWYVGVMFLNRRQTGKSFYHTFEWTLNQIVNKEYSAGYDLMVDEAIGVSDNDVFDMYYCLGMTPNLRYRQFTKSDIGSSVWVLCCDATHGHAEVKAVKMGWKHISSQQPRIYCSYSGGASATLGITNIDINSSWDYDKYEGTTQKMEFKEVVGGFEILSEPKEYTIYKSAINVTFNQYASVDDVIYGWEYIVPIAFYGRFVGDSAWTLMAEGTYDVRNSGRLVSWDRKY